MRNRKRSEGNTYHIMARGVGRQIIFEEDADKALLYRYLKEGIDKSNADGLSIEVFAWCFMDNHVHLLARGELNRISAWLQSAESRYARYFNRKYDRSGTLFQGRFVSVPVSDDAQLLTVLRYIHRNPLELGCFLAYRWSSYREYLDHPGLCNTAFCLELLGGKRAFVEFHEQLTGMGVSSIPHHIGIPEDGVILRRDVKALVDYLLRPYSSSDLLSMPRTERNRYISLLRAAGLTIKQIELSTGISRGVIQKCEIYSEQKMKSALSK